MLKKRVHVASQAQLCKLPSDFIGVVRFEHMHIRRTPHPVSTTVIADAQRGLRESRAKLDRACGFHPSLALSETCSNTDSAPETRSGHKDVSRRQSLAKRKQSLVQRLDQKLQSSWGAMKNPARRAEAAASARPNLALLPAI